MLLTRICINPKGYRGFWAKKWKKGPKITSTSGGWRCPPATSIQSRLFYDAGCIPAHLRYMLQKLSWSKRFYLRFYSFSNIGRSSVIDMSSSRPWSIHHAGPLLGGIFFIFFWISYLIHLLQSRHKYFTNDPRHSVHPESDVGDYHTRSARCVGLNCKLSGQKHSRFVFGPLEDIHDAHRNRWLPAKWWVDTLWVFPARWWVVMGVYLSCQGGSWGNSCIGCGAVEGWNVKYWIWAFVFTKRPIFFLY